jgi:hypothetical protein
MASQMHGEAVNPFPQHVQNQINRGKDDLPTFLRVLLVAFVRYENQMMTLGRCERTCFCSIFVIRLQHNVFNSLGPKRCIQNHHGRVSRVFLGSFCILQHCVHKASTVCISATSKPLFLSTCQFPSIRNV